MADQPTSEGAGAPARRAVGSGLQDLAARRLARAFLPCAVLTVAGAAVIAGGDGRDGAVLTGGGLATAATMLAVAQSIVQRAFARRARPWMKAAAMGSVLPLAFGIYVVGWHGLAGLARSDGPLDALVATLFAGVGVWLLRSWLGILEVRRLARVMLDDIDEYGGSV